METIASLPQETVSITRKSPLPKLLLADDHHLILDALESIMHQEFDVRTVDNSQAFVDAADQFKPDVAILDIGLPGADGFVTARRVLDRHPSLPIIFLSMYSDSSYVDRAAQVGAKAYVSKRTPAHELLSTVRAVLGGSSLLEQQAPPSGLPAAQTSLSRNDLTSRQREVLRLIAQGCSAKDIANQLSISVRTAEFHRAAIMQRLDLHSTAQMTRYAISNDLT